MNNKFIIIIVLFAIFSMGCVQPGSHGFKNITPINDDMVVYYVDVGQGDSEIIKTPSGKVMLIDAGDSGSDKEIGYYLEKLGVTTIDTVVVSHPHADHIGGMGNIIEKYKIGHFIESGAVTTTSMYDNMLTSIERNNIPYRTVLVGDIIDVDPQICMTVLSPARYSDNLNDNSVVIKMVYNNVSFLFTGDMEHDIENGLGDTGHIDILKVGHHGSSTSTYPFFTMITTPSVSIISVGKDNKYGHPNAITIKNLEFAGSEIYRTDYDGTIIVSTDGNYYNIVTEK